MSRISATVIALALIVAGCTPAPDAGYVTAKVHEPEWPQLILIPNGSGGSTQTWIFHPERWRIKLCPNPPWEADRANEDCGWREVSEATFDHVPDEGWYEAPDA